MRNAYMGVRLRRLREERRLTQVALAQALGLSTSYLNQLEHNQRPVTVAVLLRINEVFGAGFQLAEDDEARLIADLRDVLSDPTVTGESIAVAELRELAASMPAVGRALLTLHRRYRHSWERSDALAASLDGDRGASDMTHPPLPHEEVRDFFYDNRNHFADMDAAAERMVQRDRLEIGAMDRGLEAVLLSRHRIQVVRDRSGDSLGELRRFDPASGQLHIPAGKTPAQQAFQMATQLAFLEQGDLLADLTRAGRFSSDEARALARIGLANYFAGAVILPYTQFLDAAERLRYDIERLEDVFGVGYESVCHRLSTLQRPDARGVPFFFVRVDRAGNISKRQSATDFHFSRVGGTCPLWNVYEAFATPNRILTQVARMPDDRTYLWIARTVTHGAGAYGLPGKSFAIGLGCDIRHASRLVYSTGLDLADPSAATPIGGGCKICERPACPQRAFPPVGRRLLIDENRHRFDPYPATGRGAPSHAPAPTTAQERQGKPQGGDAD